MPKTIDSNKSDELLVSAANAAGLLSISPRTLWTLTNDGIVPHVRIGRRVMYSRTALRKWIHARMTGGNSVSH